MRKIVIAGNWKMNKTVSESVELAKNVLEAVREIKNVEVVVAPTYLASAKVADVVAVQVEFGQRSQTRQRAQVADVVARQAEVGERSPAGERRQVRDAVGIRGERCQ